MEKFRKLAAKNTVAAYIYFIAILIAAAAPMIALYLMFYLIAG